MVKKVKDGTTYVVRAFYQTSGRIEHVVRPTLFDARRTVRAYLNNTSVTTVTILKPIEYHSK